jgi:hypothetical protein
VAPQIPNSAEWEESSMSAERSTVDAIGVGTSRALFRRSRHVILLALAMLAVSAASAAAHTITSSSTCGSVTFNWTLFNSSANGNSGLNTPAWVIVFTPTGGSSKTLGGIASFAGSTSSLTVAIPSGNGVVTASSSWSSAETRDGNSNSGSTSEPITDCQVPAVPLAAAAPPVPAPVAAGPPPAVLAAAVPAPLSLVTNGSAPAPVVGTIRDTAVLSGGSSPTGTITFALYSASDTTCSRPLREVSVAVSGDGSYVSPAVTPTLTGSYQWIANYGGDAMNQSVSGSCNDPAERSTLAAAVCVKSPAALRGLPEIVTNSLSAYVSAAGVKSVTFYLDGHKRETLTKPSDQRFSIEINARTLSYGVHRLRVAVTMDRSSCANEAAAGSFIRVKADALAPTFTG